MTGVTDLKFKLAKADLNVNNFKGVSVLESLAEYIPQDVDSHTFIMMRPTVEYASNDGCFKDNDKLFLKMLLQNSNADWFAFYYNRDAKPSTQAPKVCRDTGEIPFN